MICPFWQSNNSHHDWEKMKKQYYYYYYLEGHSFQFWWPYNYTVVDIGGLIQPFHKRSQMGGNGIELVLFVQGDVENLFTPHF